MVRRGLRSPGGNRTVAAWVARRQADEGAWSLANARRGCRRGVPTSWVLPAWAGWTRRTPLLSPSAWTADTMHVERPSSRPPTLVPRPAATSGPPTSPEVQAGGGRLVVDAGTADVSSRGLPSVETSASSPVVLTRRGRRETWPGELRLRRFSGPVQSCFVAPPYGRRPASSRLGLRSVDQPGGAHHSWRSAPYRAGP